jgi:CBS domain-containing protein
MDQLNPPFDGPSASLADGDDAYEPISETLRDRRLITSLPPPPPRFRARAAAHEPRPLQIPTTDGEPRLARDLMTRQLLTIGPEDRLEHLEERMEEFQFRHLPVVEGKRLVGLITRSDLFHVSSSVLSTSAPEENAILHRLTAARVMKRDVVTARPDDSLSRVAKLLWESHLSCVPIVDDDEALVGIITEGDFVRLAHHLLARFEGTH